MPALYASPPLLSSDDMNPMAVYRMYRSRLPLPQLEACAEFHKWIASRKGQDFFIEMLGTESHADITKG